MIATSKVPSKDNLGLRVASAVFMVPAGLAVVYQGGTALMLASLLCGLGMWYEFGRVTLTGKFGITVWLSGGFVIALSCMILQYRPHLFTSVTIANLLALTLCFAVLRSRKWVWLIVGATLILLAVTSLIFIRNFVSQGLLLTVTIMICVWVTDIAAYFAGKGFGGPKLSPMGSPNKTWSGAAGAIICSGLIGILIAGLVQAALLPWLMFTASLSILSQAGDLLQSYWKRHFGVKDSGNLIPGHGGLLDRLDSFSMALVCFSLLLILYPAFPETVLGLGRI
jgi:phosphatidate cytidylyltransferase